MSGENRKPDRPQLSVCFQGAQCHLLTCKPLIPPAAIYLQSKCLICPPAVITPYRREAHTRRNKTKPPRGWPAGWEVEMSEAWPCLIYFRDNGPDCASAWSMCLCVTWDSFTPPKVQVWCLSRRGEMVTQPQAFQIRRRGITVPAPMCSYWHKNRGCVGYRLSCSS